MQKTRSTYEVYLTEAQVKESLTFYSSRTLSAFIQLFVLTVAILGLKGIRQFVPLLTYSVAGALIGVLGLWTRWVPWSNGVVALSQGGFRRGVPSELQRRVISFVNHRSLRRETAVGTLSAIFTPWIVLALTTLFDWRRGFRAIEVPQAPLWLFAALGCVDGLRALTLGYTARSRRALKRWDDLRQVS